MDVRVDGFYERMLQKLQERYHQPTVSAMMRLLIMSAAQKAGLWQEGNEVKIEIVTGDLIETINGND